MAGSSEEFTAILSVIVLIVKKIMLEYRLGEIVNKRKQNKKATLVHSEWLGALKSLQSFSV